MTSETLLLGIFFNTLEMPKRFCPYTLENGGTLISLLA